MHLDLTAALKRGGFELLKWKSTHCEVLDEVVSPEDDFKLFEESVDSAPSEKVLGVAYSFSGDAFSFMINKERALKEVRT